MRDHMSPKKGRIHPRIIPHPSHLPESHFFNPYNSFMYGFLNFRFFGFCPVFPVLWTPWDPMGPMGTHGDLSLGPFFGTFPLVPMGPGPPWAMQSFSAFQRLVQNTTWAIYQPPWAIYQPPWAENLKNLIFGQQKYILLHMAIQAVLT